MGRTIYFFGSAQDLADSKYSAEDKAAMTPTPEDEYIECPEGTITVESKVDPRKGEDSRILVNTVNTNDIGAIPFDFTGQIIEAVSTRKTYVKGSLGDVVIADDGL